MAKILALLLISLLLGYLYSSRTSHVKKTQGPRQVPQKSQVVDKIQTTLEKPIIIPNKASEQKTESVEAIRDKIKVNLSSFYTAQAAFRMDYNRYSTDLVMLGWSPQEEKLNYKMGFLKEFSPPERMINNGQAEDPSRMDTDSFLSTPIEEDPHSSIQYIESISAVNLQDYHNLCERGCTASANSFEIILITKAGFHENEDIWIINDKKQIFHVKDGITGRILRKPYKSK